LRPKIFIIENVRGLLSHNKGATLKYIIQLLQKDNLYTIEYEVINMVDYGVPQKRIRLFIIGTLKSLNLKVFPIFGFEKKQILKDVLTKVPLSKGAKYPLVKTELFKKIPQGGC
jgi:DNA (cytosine-5)-methyltransferase 1